MFIAFQNCIHVDLDVMLKVKEAINTPDEDAQYFDTFILEHRPAGNGLFDVMISPWSYDQNTIMCDKPSAFTVNRLGLEMIMEDPSQFIFDYVLRMDERYKLDDDE